jgi:hypothetical protein
MERLGHGVGTRHEAARNPGEAGVRRERRDASPRPDVRALAFPNPFAGLRFCFPGTLGLFGSKDFQKNFG